MATRKIRLTLSGTQLDGVGPLIDIDFNGENLEVDVDVNAVTGTDTLVKEYTVDVAPGTYNLDITFKNDGNNQEGQDRNFTIERVEIANDGSTYSNYLLTTTNINAAIFVPVSGYVRDLVDGVGVPNPDFDPGAVRTDSAVENNYKIFSNPGANAKYLYSYIDPASVLATMYTNGVGSINVIFE